MVKKIILISALITIVLLCSVSLYSQYLGVDVYYLRGEQSKDSHSSEEKISVSSADGLNGSGTYSIKYSGKRGKNNEDIEKTCTFTEQNIKNIVQTITVKELNVNDSLIDETSKSKSIEFYTNISITIVMEGKEYKIKINGDTENLGSEKLYKNAVFFITMLKKMSMDC